MALQVPSGLITSVSGGGLVSGTTLPLFSYPIPMVLVGANGASASGNHSITDFSGALNVNISGGTLSANISGQTVNSNVSGNVVQIQSGGVAIFSGEVHVMSGNIAVLSGIVGVASGTVNVISGVVSVMSGLITIQGSGSTPFTMLSGNVGVSGQVQSGAWVQPIILLAYDYSGLAYYPVAAPISGIPMLNVAIGNASTGSSPANVLGGGNDAQNTTNAGLVVIDFNNVFNGTTWGRMRSVTGSSGGSQGVLATQPVGYSYSHIAGAAAITNIKSGAAFLHTIIINDYTSGQGFTVYDSASGVGGNTIAAPNPFAGGLTPTDLPPASLLFDILVTSGLVVSTSGAGWDITVTWRTATS